MDTNQHPYLVLLIALAVGFALVVLAALVIGLGCAPDWLTRFL